MTMQVFALLGSVTPAPTVSQGQFVLTDYAEGQQQSYSEDVATLLANMESALKQLDSEMQQLPPERDTAESAQDQELVPSMLPQPLPFDLTVSAAAPLTASTPTEPAEQLNTAATMALSAAWRSEDRKTEVAELSAASVPTGVLPAIGTAPQAVSTTLPLASVPQQESFSDLNAARVLVQLQTSTGAEWMSGLSPSMPELVARGANPGMALDLNKLPNLSQTVAVPHSTAMTDTAALSGALAPAYGTAASALPVWQADPLPAQSQHFGQRLVQMLADKVDLQLGLNVNKAMIRLDPPSLGSIELSVQLEGDRLTVQMHSSNTQLRDAMGQGLEQLRASLQQKLGADVQIDLRMGSDSSSQQQQQKTPQQLAQQLASNFVSEPETAPTEAKQSNKLNLVNQLV